MNTPTNINDYAVGAPVKEVYRGLRILTIRTNCNTSPRVCNQLVSIPILNMIREFQHHVFQ